jgi:hypothetical protein
MFTEWSDIFTAAIQTLTPLHREIVTKTMQIPGKRTRLFYREALNLWSLDRKGFDIQREAAFEAVRLYLLRHGLTAQHDLML